MDMIKILGSLLASGALSKGSGGDVLGSLIGAALGGSQNQKTQGGGALGDILGSLVGAGQSSGASTGGMGDILGSLVGAGKSGASAGGLGDLLGSLVGGASSSSNAGGGLGDLLGSLVAGAAPTHQPSSRRAPTSASDLEDLLGIGKQTNNTGLGGAGGLGGLLGGALTKYAQHNNPNVPTPSANNYDVLPFNTDKKEAVDHATLIIRAMINAAKSDGSIDQAEQEKVLAKLGDITQEEIDFVKREFAAPLDADAFARSIPRGMADQIYAVSLMAIDLDQNAEAQYLADLAKGLGISTQLANQMHDKFGVPKIFAS
jgi:uncharacterized membrane protein YebE (DUF533 family)